MLTTDTVKIEKLYDISTTASSFLYEPISSGTTIPTNRIAMHNNEVQQPGLAATLSSSQKLGDKYLKVFSALRGGNHPFLEKYKAHYNSMGVT
jgi:hypothetical protein